MVRHFAPLVAWVGMLVALMVTMVAAGRGDLAGPPWLQPSGWSAWAAERGGPAASLAVVRVVVLAVAGWLLLVTAVTLARAAGRRGRELEVAELLGLPIVHRVVQGALGLGLAGATAAGVAGIGGAGGPRPVEVAAPASSVPAPPPGPELADPSSTTTTSPTTTTTSAIPSTDGAWLDGGRATTTTVPVGTTTVPPLATTTTVPAGQPLSPPLPPPAPAPTPAVVAAVPDLVATVDQPRVWVVGPGEHLWSIARALVEDAAGRPATDAEVVPLWRELTERNRDRLADPANPDLLFPGDRLVVPPVPSRP